MNRKMHKFFIVLKDIYLRFEDDDIPALAAQLTYYLLLSFFPFFIFFITLLSFTPITSDQAINYFHKILPQSSFNILFEVIKQVQRSNKGTFISFGMIATIWAASNGMNAVIKGINKAYDQHETRSFWKVRAVSIIATIALAMTIILSFILLVFGEVIGAKLFDYLGYPHLFIALWNLVRYSVPTIVMVTVFTLLYKFTPNKRLHIKEVFAGSLFSTVGWSVTSILFSIYVNNFSNYSKTYGSIGGIIILLVWLYWISMIILLGGEVNAAIVFFKKRHKISIPQH